MNKNDCIALDKKGFLWYIHLSNYDEDAPYKPERTSLYSSLQQGMGEDREHVALNCYDPEADSLSTPERWVTDQSGASQIEVRRA